MNKKTDYIDPFYISRIKVTYMESDGRHMFMELNFGNYIEFEGGTENELKDIAIAKAKLKKETESFKWVEVFGYDRLSDRTEYLTSMIECMQDEMDGEDPWYESEESFSFIYDYGWMKKQD